MHYILKNKLQVSNEIYTALLHNENKNLTEYVESITSDSSVKINSPNLNKIQETAI